jgi:hypothetical protein
MLIDGDPFWGLRYSFGGLTTGLVRMQSAEAKRKSAPPAAGSKHKVIALVEIMPIDNDVVVPAFPTPTSSGLNLSIVSSRVSPTNGL